MYEYDRNPKSRYAAEMARRRQIARSACRPGERWLPSIGKCAGLGRGMGEMQDISLDSLKNSRNMGDLSDMNANKAIKAEIMARKSANMDNIG